MKLAYIFLGGSKNGSSVQHKILCQIAALNKNGIEAKGYLFSSGIDGEIKLNETASIYPLKPYSSKRKYFRNYFENQYYYEQIREFITRNCNNVDCIFLRHGASGPSYFKLLHQFASKLYLYIPSHSIRENFMERKAAPQAGMLGLAFRWWEYLRYFYLPEKKLIRRILPKLKGVVVFTPEFGKILNKQAGGNIRIVYNRDGADCSTVKMRDARYTGDKIKLLFMKGSSMQQPWSGLNRLIQSIQSSGEGRFELLITGNVVEKEKYNYPFVTLTGRLSEAELETLTDGVDLGVSNLANYMIHFNETTNLKSRDYYARGLPFIQANSMPDVDGTEGESYYLNLPNTAALIDMNLVAGFALQMRGEKDHPQKMRAFAEKHLDWNITVAELATELKRDF